VLGIHEGTQIRVPALTPLIMQAAED